MITSSTTLVAALAISAGLLTTNAALAKGGPGKSGGSGGGNHSRMSSSNSSAFKLSSKNNTLSNHSNSMSGISKKNLSLSQSFKKQDLSFKKQDFNKDHKNSTLGISLNSLKKDNHPKDFFKKDNSKDFFFKKDYCKKGFCWWDSCYSKNYCYPYYFGCYYPTYSCYSPSYCYSPLYSCYDYCTPAYTSVNYGNYSGSITVLQNVVEPSRTQVAVGSVLMVNGQAFGDKAGGARLRISGMAMPIEVLEWTPAGVKVRLPQVEITGSTPAEIEVVRGDGSLASKTAVELIPSPEQLALGR
jgi:hypothetical protein